MRLTRRTAVLAAEMALCLVPGYLGATEATTPLELARQLNQAFAEVAQKVSPAVVIINVVQKMAAPSADEDEDGPYDSLPPGFLKRFHEQFRSLPEVSEGSGIILREDGYILTNNHVVEDADKVEVKLQDGRRMRATIRGMDPQSDLAVIKIEATGLPVAKFADSARTRVGEFAIAVGAPFRLDYSVTFGHVSAKGRSNVLEGLDTSGMDQDFIQTDASINPGNSGGPLLDSSGRLIGVNTAIASPSGGSTGVGFAIPVDNVKQVVESIIRNRPTTWLQPDGRHGAKFPILNRQPENVLTLAAFHHGVMPPLTQSVWPLMNEASSLAKYRQA